MANFWLIFNCRTGRHAFLCTVSSNTDLWETPIQVDYISCIWVCYLVFAKASKCYLRGLSYYAEKQSALRMFAIHVYLYFQSMFFSFRIQSKYGFLTSFYRLKELIRRYHHSYNVMHFFVSLPFSMPWLFVQLAPFYSCLYKFVANKAGSFSQRIEFCTSANIFC